VGQPQRQEATRDTRPAATISTQRRVRLRWTSALLVTAAVVLVAASVVDLGDRVSSSLHHRPELGVSFAVPEGWEGPERDLAFVSPDGEVMLFVSRYVHRDASDFVAASRWNLHWYGGVPPGWRLVTDDEIVVDGRVGWWLVAEGPPADGRSPRR
jgi:hypothetical protein